MVLLRDMVNPITFVVCILLCGLPPLAEAAEQPKELQGSGGCSSSGATSSIHLSIEPARITGIAPLSVFFDATGTTASSTTRPFHDLDYRWDFGDKTSTVPNLTSSSPVNNTWNAGSRSGISNRNTASGPITAHLYETPGSYTVTLSVTDGTSLVSNSCTIIMVQDSDMYFSNANTICVGAVSRPTHGQGGCPAGAKTIQQTNFTAAINSYAKTGKRVLFKRGDVFEATNTATITAAGPGTIGSFGSGMLPVVQMTGNTDTLVLSSRSTPNFSDWRIMDLELDGMGSPASHGLGLGGGAKQITIQRLTMRNFEASIGFGGDIINWWNNSPGGPNGHTIDQIAIVDSTVISGTNTAYGSYIAGNRISFMGNKIDNGGIQIRHDAQGKAILNSTGNPSNGSHVTRWTYLNKGVISNNTLSRPGFDRHIIKLHAPTWINGLPDSTQKSNYSRSFAGDGYSKQIVISDNKFTDYLNGWSISIGPQDSESDERVRDVILERNLHITTPTSQAGQVIRAQEVTSRNNLYLGGGSNSQTFVRIDVDGREPPASNVRIYNNSQYSSDIVPSDQFIMVYIGDYRVSNITIKNNLAYAPNANHPLLFTNSGAKNVSVSNNSTNSQIKNTSPLFSSTPPILISDWSPKVGSYAINAGATVPVWSDFYLNNRPQHNMIDIGAIELP